MSVFCFRRRGRGAGALYLAATVSRSYEKLLWGVIPSGARDLLSLSLVRDNPFDLTFPHSPRIVKSFVSPVFAGVQPGKVRQLANDLRPPLLSRSLLRWKCIRRALLPLLPRTLRPCGRIRLHRHDPQSRPAM